VKSGFIALIGHPNVGKSTFLNQVLGEKVTITSTKPQTTRNTIRGIYTDDEAQMVFLDTPGISKPKHELGAYMRRTAFKSLEAVDLVLLMVDALDDKRPFDEKLLERIKQIDTPMFLIVNKIDAVRDFDRLKAYVERLKKLYDVDEAFLISAKEGWHTDRLLSDIKDGLEEGPAYYPKEWKTDQPERFVIAERIREKVLEFTHEEVPHSVAVILESLETDDAHENLLNVYANIIVERPSQKKIVIGKGGEMMKKIGTAARKDLADLLGSKIYLDLHCKVMRDWRHKQQSLRHVGYKDE